MNNKIFEKLQEVQLLTLCMWGEARGEGLDGMLAVGSVVLNRVREKKFGEGIRGVVLRPKQFSCFNEGEPNREKLEIIASDFELNMDTIDSLKACFWVASGLMFGYLKSNVKNANHYNTIGVDPKWDDNMQLISVIGRHEYFYGH